MLQVHSSQPKTLLALRDMMGAMSAATSEDGLLAELAQILLTASDADGCDILLSDDGQSLILRASTYAPDYTHRCRLGKGIGLSGIVHQTGNPVFVRRNAMKHPRYVSYPGLDERHCEGVAVIPFWGASRTLGACFLHRERVWPLSQRQKQRILEHVCDAARVWEGFENALQRGASSNRMGALTEVSRTLSTSPYVEEILQLLVNITAQQFNYKVCTVRLLDEARGELVLRATQAPARAYRKKRAIKLGESIAGRAISERRAVTVRDVRIEPDYIGHELAVEQGLCSMICVPLLLQDRTVGVLSCYTDHVRDFPSDEIAALETIAKQAAVSIEHARLQVRSTLLQEVHHRVKNNLQQIASLLRLQIRHGAHKTLDEALGDSLSRILAIASVHELLSREDLDHVGLRSLAEDLIHHQRESLMLPDRSIEFEVRGEDVHLHTTQATQVALVLNELIQNAVEHGFRDSLSGNVHITIEERDGEIGLWVSNDGDRLPTNFELGANSRLGLQIAQNLARSLGGRFVLEEKLGWAVAELKFSRTSSE